MPTDRPTDARATLADLVKAMEEFDAGSMLISANDGDGTPKVVTVMARGEEAVKLARLYDREFGDD